MEAVTNILNSTHDLYILDINVPGFDGHKVLEFIRKEHDALPVIMISALSNIENIHKSYDLGCNDYLKKPFDIEELFLRIKYHIKTTLHQDIDKSIIDLNYGYNFCIKTLKLLKHQHKIDLTQKEKLLLSLLVQNYGNTISFDMIHEYVWEGKEIESVSMRTIIHKLQKKLKHGMIVNIRGVGYKLMNSST